MNRRAVRQDTPKFRAKMKQTLENEGEKCYNI